jgi:hypothetical protein
MNLEDEAIEDRDRRDNIGAPTRARRLAHTLANPADPELSPCAENCTACLLEKDEWYDNLNRKTETTEALLMLHEHLGKEGRKIMAIKNSDYGALGGDPFRNFQAFGAFGILIRLSDKLARLRTFIEKAQQGQELAVKDEKWEDTLIDAINYLVLLDGFIRTHGVK